MEKSLARPAGDVQTIVHTYGNMLFRLCLITLGKASDAEDVIQETMITYLLNHGKPKGRSLYCHSGAGGRKL